MDFLRKYNPFQKHQERKLVKYHKNGTVLAVLIQQGIPSSIIDIDDKAYILPTEDEIWKVILASGIRDLQYIPDTRDCDDFARKMVEALSERRWLIGEAKAIVMIRGKAVLHYFNWFMLEGWTLVMFDPQDYRTIKRSEIVEFKRFRAC